MLVMEDKKVSFRLDLPAELVEKSDELFKAAGMTRTEGTTRLMEWFNSAPNEVHLLVFGVLEGRPSRSPRLQRRTRYTAPPIRKRITTPLKCCPGVLPMYPN